MEPQTSTHQRFSTTTTQPEVVHMVSMQTNRNKRGRQGSMAPPPPPRRSSSDAAQPPIPADAAAVADVFCWWTGYGRAPWMLHNNRADTKKGEPTAPKKRGRARAATTGKKKKSAGKRKRTRTGNALFRLDRDMYLALRDASKRFPMIPFAGKTIELRASQGSVGETPHIRVVAVLWAPSFLAAKRQSISIRGSSEHGLVQLLDNFMQRQAVDVTLTVAYVLPRWVKAPQPVSSGLAHNKVPSKFTRTPPAALAYGAWQLGMRICMLRPHMVLSTSADVARVVGCTGGLDVASLCTEQGKRAISEMPVLPIPKGNDQEPLVVELPCILRPVQSLTDPQAPPRTLRFPPKLRRGVPRTAPIQHMRCPHPYQMTKPIKGPEDGPQRQAARQWFAIAMAKLARVAHQYGERGHVRQRLVFRLGAPFAPRASPAVDADADTETETDDDVPLGQRPTRRPRKKAKRDKGKEKV